MGSALIPTTLASMRAAAHQRENDGLWHEETYIGNRRATVTEIAERQIGEAVRAVKEAGNVDN